MSVRYLIYPSVYKTSTIDNPLGFTGQIKPEKTLFSNNLSTARNGVKNFNYERAYYPTLVLPAASHSLILSTTSSIPIRMKVMITKRAKVSPRNLGHQLNHCNVMKTTLKLKKHDSCVRIQYPPPPPVLG